MTGELIEKEVDIYQYPAEFEGNHGSITIGDLHGNSVKLVHFLLRHKVIGFKNGVNAEEAYNRLVTVYEQLNEVVQEKSFDLNRQLSDLVYSFNQFIEQLVVIDNKVLVRLLGDELADRGSNDYLTLRILSLLNDAGVNVHIMLSNHGYEFIVAYEYSTSTQDFKAKYLIPDSHKTSIIGLKTLLYEKIVAGEELLQLVSKAYKPCLLLIDYTLSANGINLFTHAPVAFNVIRYTALKLAVAYDDSSKEALALTIDKINAKFRLIVKQNCVHEYGIIGSEQVHAYNMTAQQMQTYPLLHTIWNRWSSEKDTAEARPVCFNGYNISYFHGHDSYESQYKHVTNLDTPSGKTSRQTIAEQIKLVHTVDANAADKEDAQLFLDHINQYKVWNSNDFGLKQSLFKAIDAKSSLAIRAGIAALIGALIGGIGAATGLFPFFSVIACAAALGVGALLVIGVLDLITKQVSKSSCVSSSIVNSCDELTTQDSLSIMNQRLGVPSTQANNVGFTCVETSSKNVNLNLEEQVCSSSVEEQDVEHNSSFKAK